MGWASPLPITELNAKPQDLHAIVYRGSNLESAPARKVDAKSDRSLSGNIRWAGDRSKYFLAVAIPDSGTISEAIFRPTGDGMVTAWLVGSAPPGTEVSRHTRLYVGPIHFETLAALGAALEEIANPSILGMKWLVPISVLLLRLLNLLYRFIPNYGVAVLLLAAGTKFAFYPLSQSSLRSMKVMHRLQPEVDRLRERHAKDPAKMNAALMALYKENKVNPMGGCLPLLLQFPVFISLYNVLYFSIELRASSFVGYIQDLSSPDVLARIGGFPLHLLPLVMTASTYILQQQTPTTPQQQSMMYVMPAVMLFVMYNFPSGVILYWTVNNLLSALQQYLVNQAEDRRMAAAGA
jgi:YidC/Oxa1 family membrane protein insertase